VAEVVEPEALAGKNSHSSLDRRWPKIVRDERRGMERDFPCSLSDEKTKSARSAWGERWQRLHAEYAKQFGMETPNSRAQAAQKS
jgi:hypothetical protein